MCSREASQARYISIRFRILPNLHCFELSISSFGFGFLAWHLKNQRMNFMWRWHLFSKSHIFPGEITTSRSLRWLLGQRTEGLSTEGGRWTSIFCISTWNASGKLDPNSECKIILRLIIILSLHFTSQQARICESKGQPPNNGALAEGFSNRYFEFQDFERKFEECISKSAVKTKFEQHSSRGKTIANEMHQMLDEIFERAGSIRNKKLEQKSILTDRIGHTEQELMSITREMKLKIHNMVEEVEQKVSKALNEEIWRLNVLVDEFNLPFHTEPLVLNVYKKEINSHVENGLGSNLKSRLSTAMAMNIETAQREMTERMHSLIPVESIRQQSKQILARTQPFEMFYTLNCQNLCADFQEDLEFKFSWGITAMIQRFTGKVKNKPNKGAIMYNRQNSTTSVSCQWSLRYRWAEFHFHLIASHFCVDSTCS